MPSRSAARPEPGRRHAAPALAAALSLALLAGCASGPPLPRGAHASTNTDTDGPGERPPAGLDRIPDATPRPEAIRAGGPNKPYAIAGRSYVPLAAEAPLRETGLASWYGRKYHGRPTAMGEIYDMYAMTAAHPTLPLPSYARVRNTANGREVLVRVNDRGPFVPGRVIDLSYTAALRLGVLGGLARVELERITPEEIRSGRWASAAGAPVVPPVVPPVVAPVADVPVPGSIPPPATELQTSDGAGWWLQLGAFRQRDGALALQQQLQRDLAGMAPGLALRDEDGVFRVQAGPWPSREAAQQALEQLRRQLGRAAVMVDRR